MALVGAIAGVAQTGFGIYQMIKGQRDLKKAQAARPTYQIPAEIQQNLTQAQVQALQGMPAEQQRLYVENIQRGLTSGLRGLSSRKAGLSGVTALAQQEADVYKQLLGMDVEARQANQQQLMAARSEMAGFREKEWEMNQYLPYLQQYQQAQAMMGAGTKNIGGGLQGVAGAFGLNGEDEDEGNGLFGKRGKQKDWYNPIDMYR